MKTITANEIIARARYKRLHRIKKRWLTITQEARAHTSNLQEPWVEKYPWLVQSQRRQLEKKLKRKKTLEWEYIRRKSKFG